MSINPMRYDLEEINFKTVADPKGFIGECDDYYHNEVNSAAEKIAEALEERGVRTHYVAMDDYFNTVTPETVPRTPEGEMDLESPLCLDMELLNRHFAMLSRGERIYVPKFEFSRQMRVQEPGKSLRLHADEVVIFEGIHALNDMITNVHPEAFKLYISARSDVVFEDRVVFKRTWFRLVRRMVRDYNFRGSDPQDTLRMWGNVRRGEIAYISPFKDKADYQFDSSFPYEMSVFNHTATKLFQSVPEGVERFEELRRVLPALQLFGVISETLVAPDAMIREFIGGGVYDY